MNKILLFTSTRCAPCQVQKTILKDLTDKAMIQLEVLDINEHPDECTKYHVRSVPTMILFKDGEISRSFPGLTKLEDIRKCL